MEDYNQNQKKHKDAYLNAYADWLASMTPGERREAARLGVDAPALPTISGALPDNGNAAPDAPSFDADGAEIEDGEPGAEMAAPDESPSESLLAAAEERARLGIVIRKLIGELLAARNRSLAVECMALVTGILYDGVSEAAIAKRFNITRAAVSKRCVEMAERLNIPPSRAMAQMKREVEAAEPEDGEESRAE